MAILTRETAVLFALACAGALLLHRRGRPSWGRAALFPFQGIGHSWPWGEDSVRQAYGIVLPGMLVLVLGLRALVRREWRPALSALVANASS
jgi:hypothetical protein